jgi:CheY-like chemotaxis protein
MTATGKHILLVDDEVTVLKMVFLSLSHYGYHVEAATSGAEALAKVTGGDFDLVITDLRMPGMSGDQLAAHIRERYPTIPVLLLTGNPPDKQPAAVDMVLGKPISIDHLRQAVDQLTNADVE